MELNILKKNLLNNSFLKLYALCVGYSIWYCLSTLVPVTYRFTIPLSFYGSHTSDSILDAPEYITVSLAAYKKDFYALNKENLAFHINSDNLVQGNNTIPTTQNHLSLPDRYTLVHAHPAYLTITKQPKDTVSNA
jgi:hypothetical protein